MDINNIVVESIKTSGNVVALESIIDGEPAVIKFNSRKKTCKIKKGGKLYSLQYHAAEEMLLDSGAISEIIN